MTRSLLRLAASFTAAFFALAALLAWWALYRAPALTGRLDNPRRPLAERAALRGQIVDRNGLALAATVGQRGSYQRVYPVPATAPVVGYDSAVYGQAGLEAALDPLLSGRARRDPARAWWENLLYGGPPHGRDVALTLDADLQRAAAAALNGAAGAVVLLDAQTGEVLALASAPTFDPNRLDEDWASLQADAASPLLNRATQGQYPPGAALQPVVLAAALNASLARPADPYPNGALPVPLDGSYAACAGPAPGRGPLSLAEAFRLACPGPFADLGSALGPERLLAALEAFALFELLPFPLPLAVTDRPDLIGGDVRMEALGQGQMLVSPLQMALVAAAFANGGRMPAPHLLARSQPDIAAGWAAASGASRQVISAEVAAQVSALTPALAPKRSAGASVAAPADSDIGRVAAMAQAGVIGHVGAAIGGQGGQLGWFLGYVGRYAVVVVLEGGTPGQAAAVGVQMLVRAGL